jgi:hypothetical protein
MYGRTTHEKQRKSQSLLIRSYQESSYLNVACTESKIKEVRIVDQHSPQIA